tara:strand:+ start:238 stop:441 length:204 start_codon:yes stop_codon:yes gene_type:complete
MAGIGIAKRGLGLLGKRKKLTVDKGALRISEINKKLKKTPNEYKQDVHEEHAQEVADIYAGKWKGKK